MNKTAFRLVASDARITGADEKNITVEFHLDGRRENGFPQFVFFAHAVLWQGGIFELSDNQLKLLRLLYESDELRIPFETLKNTVWERSECGTPTSIKQLVYRLNMILEKQAVPVRVATDEQAVWVVVEK